MDTELTYLAWTIVLGLVQVIATAQFLTAANGFAYGAGNRDTPPPRRMSIYGERLERATKNLLETFAFAAAAILIVHVTGRHNALTYWGATFYFWARLAYVGIYVAGITYVRTMVFLVSVLGILLMLLGLHWG
ncbi:MAPEG family protein [uncultured Enterovirga sp.]|uniref:MAPEG family protein n=1 Tax=uncultured Enterovirga sp. TaxID=2026352 RepID=UPI0035CC59DE